MRAAIASLHASAPLPPQAPMQQPAPLHVRGAIVCYLAQVREENRADSTQTSYLYQLSIFFGPVLGEPVAALTCDRLAQLRQRIQTTVNTRTAARYSESTVLLYWAVSRKFARWCYLQGWLPADPTQGGAP